MGFIQRTCVLVSAFFLISLLLQGVAGCGGGNSRVVALREAGSGSTQPETDAGAAPPAGDVITREEALAQIQACDIPQDVDPQHWQELQNALKQVLQQKAAGEIPVTPPTGEFNRVNNIQYSANPGEPLVLYWYYVNVGDYNQDGLISVSDITPLGVHFGEQSIGFPEPWQYDHEMSVVDGSGDGMITVGDITPLGANFQSRVSEYAVFGSGYEGIQKIGSVDFADAYRVPNKRLSFRFEMDPAVVVNEIWVVPSDGSTYGAPSMPAGSEPVTINAVSPASGTTGAQVTFSVRVGGSAPFAVQWDFGGAATPSSSSDYMPEVTLGPPGSYLPKVTVSNDQGSAVYDFALLILEEGAVAGPGDWWMYGHDPQHTGRSAYIGPATTELRWQITYMGNWPSYSSVIGADGTVYVSSGELSTLLAIGPGGNQLWAYDAGDAIQCCPAIGSDGTIYCGSRNNLLHAVNPDGTEFWTYELDDSVTWSSPALDEDGTIYIGCKDNKLYAINPDGSFKWAYETGDWVFSSPAIAADGTVYIGSRDNQLHAVDSNGGAKWTFPTWGWISSSPAVGADGTIYVGSMDQRLYAINPSGMERWAYDTGGSIQCSPALAADGTIYVGAGGGTQEGIGRFLALNSDGSLKWSFEPTSACSFSSPIIDAAGSIYFGTEDGTVYALNPDGSVRWVYKTDVAVRCSPSIGPDGTLYFTSNNGALYAMGPGGGEPQPTTVEIINVEPQWGDSGAEITVSADVRGSPPFTYSWDFNGAATPGTSTDAQPTIVLGDHGSYLATLEVSNATSSNSYAFYIIVGDGTQWSQSYYGEANDIDQDAAGNIYVAGETYLGSSIGDALVLKYSADGELLWQRTWGGGARATEIEVGAAGDVYVVGSVGSISAGDTDVLLLKYTADGALVWQRTWGTTDYNVAAGLALDSGMLDGIEHIYVSATVEEEPNVDYDAALLKYTPQGDLLWQQSWGGTGNDRGGPVAVYYSSAEAYEVVYQAGSTESYGAGGDDDAFLLRYYPTGGDPIWQHTWGSTYYDGAEAIAVDGDENIYVAASHLRDLGEGPYSDVALLKYTKGGSLEFALAWTEYPTDIPLAIAIDQANAIYISGYQGKSGDDGEDLFLLQCSADGELNWQRVWGRWSGELGTIMNLGHARAMQASASGELLIAGVGGRIGLWTDADGTAEPVLATIGSPTGTITALTGAVTTPDGFISIPNGEGPGDLTLMKYDPGN